MNADDLTLELKKLLYSHKIVDEVLTLKLAILVLDHEKEAIKSLQL